MTLFELPWYSQALAAVLLGLIMAIVVIGAKWVTKQILSH